MTVRQLERSTRARVLGDMGYSTMPANLTPAEELAYRRGFDRADRAFLKASGGPGVVHDGDAPAPGTAARRMLAQTLEANGRAYRIARHDKCHAGGMSAVRAYLRKTGQLSRLEELAPAKGARKTTRRAPAVVPVETPPAAPVVDTAPAPVKLRKTSKLAPCPGHADYWESLTPADRFKNACEGGNGSSACTDGDWELRADSPRVCTLTPGTDRYTADLVGRGPVTLAELNGQAPGPVAVDTTPADVLAAGIDSGRVVIIGVTDTAPDPDPVHAGYLLNRDGATTDTGPVCGRPDVTAGELVDDGHTIVTCPGCLEIVHSLIPPVTVPAPMPGMTRAARVQSRRELAATRRAAGLPVSGPEWIAAKVTAGIVDSDTAGQLEGVTR